MLNRDRQRHSGFTLMEMLIVVAVIAILAAIAYPNYSRYTFRARRVDGKNLLAQIATAEERFYGVANVYTNNITGAAPAGLALTNLSEKGYYTAAVVLGAGGQTYTLRATPAGVQATDVCGILSVDNTGLKAPANGLMPQNSNGNCW